VTAILPVSSGHLLVGTKKRGVLIYDGKTLEELHPTLGHFYVQALAGSEVDLWVGTLDQGVKHWHAGTTETFAEEQGLPDRQVQDQRPDQNHHALELAAVAEYLVKWGYDARIAWEKERIEKVLRWPVLGRWFKRVMEREQIRILQK